MTAPRGGPALDDDPADLDSVVGTPDPSSPGQPGPPTHAVSRHRRWIIALVGVVIGLVAVGAGAAWLLGREDTPAPTVTVTRASPTPTVSPIDRGEQTAFMAALPSTVNEYAMTSIAPQPWTPSDGVPAPLEGYVITYTSGSRTLTVFAGQWATPEDAAAALGQLEAKAFVNVDEGTEMTTWSNATANFAVTGNEQDRVRFVAAFPM